MAFSLLKKPVSKHSLRSLLRVSSHFYSAQPHQNPIQEPKQPIEKIFNTQCTQFLTQECGISDLDLKNLSKRFEVITRSKSITKFRSTVQFLRDFGFPSECLSALVKRCPHVLVFKADRLRPKLESLKSFGFAEKTIIDIVTRNPRILTADMDNKIIPNIQALEHVFEGQKNLNKIIEKFPSILLANMEKHVYPCLTILKNSGIEGKSLISLITRKPSILTLPEKTIISRLNFVKNLRIEEESLKSFAWAVEMCIIYDVKKQKAKFENIVKLGFEKEEVTEMCRKCPSLIVASPEKLEKNMDFLVRRAGFEAVVKNPALLKCSLEKNLMPRYAVISYLREVDSSRSLPLLQTAFKMGEKAFLEKFITGSCHSLKLMEIYKKDYTRPTKRRQGRRPKNRDEENVDASQASSAEK